MGELYTLPLELDKINSCNGINVDMSDTKFPVSKEKQKRAAFIFIRNTNINAVFNFDKCSYEDKAEYLMMYLQSNIVLHIDDLITTWISIISHGYVEFNDLKSILDKDEMDQFCKDNESFIYEMRRISISIPLCSIAYYNKTNGNTNYSMDIESNDFDSFNFVNFSRMADHYQFIILVNEIPDINPMYYSKFFGTQNPYFGKLIERFPYMNLLNVMMGGEESMNLFIDILSGYMKDGICEQNETIKDEAE